MGPDEKNTGPLAVYMDGQPVGIAYGEIQEISLVAEEPAEAMRWASVYNRPLAYRYRHTKKKRTRKKYAKRILAWYREEVL